MLVPVNRWILPELLLLLFGCSKESRWRMKADMGDPVAMRQLGEALQRAGSHDEFNEGTGWLMKAAEKGDLEAMYSMGLQYDSPGSEAKALHWYRKGAEAGHRFCMIKLANA